MSQQQSYPQPAQSINSTPPSKRESKKRVIGITIIFIIFLAVSLGIIAMGFQRGGMFNPYSGHLQICVNNNDGLFGKDYKLYINGQSVAIGYILPDSSAYYDLFLKNDESHLYCQIYVEGFRHLDQNKTTAYKEIDLHDGQYLQILLTV